MNGSIPSSKPIYTSSSRFYGVMSLLEGTE